MKKPSISDYDPELQRSLRSVVRVASRLSKLASLGAPELVIESERRLLLQYLSDMPTSTDVRVEHDKTHSPKFENQLHAKAKELFEKANPGQVWQDSDPELMGTWLHEAHLHIDEGFRALSEQVDAEVPDEPRKDLH